MLPRMYYTPAFTEIFLGLVAVVLWAAWLKRRPGPQGVIGALPWVAGAAVLIGQAAATYALVTQLGGVADPTLVRVARWGSLGVVAGCLVVELGLTAWSFAQRTRNHHQARP
jgi:hypothetical protein